jgi:hypothetical protein
VAHAPTDRLPAPTPRTAALLAALALLPAGCGLSDYAAQMSSEASRVRQWEEEAKVLGDPLRMPQLPKKDDKEQTWNVFLRPPHGISDKPVAQQQDTKLSQQYGPLVQYPGSQNSPTGIQALYLGVGSDPKEFAGQVYSQFATNPGGESTVTIPRSEVLLSGTAGALDPEIRLKRKTHEGQALYQFNFYERGKVQVAVVFQLAKGNAAKADVAIRTSLGTLGEGRGEVPVLRDSYLKSHRKK